MYYLWDLYYETLSDIKHGFYLSSIEEVELTLSCEYIEFVEAEKEKVIFEYGNKED